MLISDCNFVRMGYHMMRIIFGVFGAFKLKSSFLIYFNLLTFSNDKFNNFMLLGHIVKQTRRFVWGLCGYSLD